MSTKRRLDPAIFHLPVERMRAGYYSDQYFNRAATILERDDHHPIVRMQVFQRSEAVLCGIDEAIAILKLCSTDWSKLRVNALNDGDRIAPYETIMTIEGPYESFARLETPFLGVLSRRTRIATNSRHIVDAANGKPVLFFPARFDHYLVQTGDGYAAYIAGAFDVSTDANAEWWGERGKGTVPHSLIAAYGGDTVLATMKFAEHTEPDVQVISLVDYDNDCVGTSLQVARALGDRLWGVRLDTAGTLVDKSVLSDMGTFKPTGVVPQLVHNVRDALDAEHFGHVKIVVSGGFNPERITAFEADRAPVDVYAVGSAFFDHAGQFDFTADIVALNLNDVWHECHKAGRPERPNLRLQPVE